MVKTINHEAFVNLFNKNKKVFELIFKDNKTLSQLSSKIIKVSKTFDKFAYKDADKLKGDLFEIFAECFFKLLSSDNRIGVYNYQPAPPIDDYGVDGFGIGMDQNPLTVQIKFRSDATTELTLKDIKNFQGTSFRNYKVPVDTTTNLVFFTNAKGLHWITEAKVLSGASKTFGYSEISQLIDNNLVFWNNLNDLIQETIVIKYGKVS
jgi:hypothetical protein